MVVAKNLETHRILSEQFKGRKVRKEYTALVYGRPVPARRHDRSTTRDAILKNRKKISARARHHRTSDHSLPCGEGLRTAVAPEGADRNRPNASDPGPPVTHRPSGGGRPSTEGIAAEH